jgi:hypothetical protein
MTTFNSTKCAAVLLSVLALSMPMAHAGEDDCDCPCDPERATAMATANMNQDGQRSNQRTTAATRSSTPRANATAQGGFIETLPVRGYHSDSLVGHEITNRRNDESIGEITDLLLDEDGQVTAVLISVGGLLGLGERDLAISWDRIERIVDGDDFTLSIDMTEDMLKNAPEYSDERMNSRW